MLFLIPLTPPSSPEPRSCLAGKEWSFHCYLAGAANVWRQERRKEAGGNNLRGKLTALCSCLKGGSGQLGLSLLSQATSTRIRGNGLKLSQEGSDWVLGKYSSPKRVAKHWNRLPRGTVEPPSLETDVAFNDMFWLKVGLGDFASRVQPQ